MLYRRHTIAFVAASALILACADAPVAPRTAAVTPVEDAAIASVRGGNKHRAALSGVVKQTIGTNVIDAVVQVTSMSLSTMPLPSEGNQYRRISVPVPSGR